MNYYQLNKDRLLQKAKDRYHNGTANKKLLNIMKTIKNFFKKCVKEYQKNYQVAKKINNKFFV